MSASNLTRKLQQLSAWERLSRTLHFAQRLLWYCLLAALALLAIDKLFFLNLDPIVLAALATAVTATASLAYYLLTPRQLLTIAYHTDRHHGFKNLIASSLEASPESEVGAVVHARAEQAITDCHGRAVFPPRLLRTSPYLPLLIILMLALPYVPSLDLAGRETRYQQQQQEQQEIERSAVKLRDKMSEIMARRQNEDGIKNSDIAADLNQLSQDLPELSKKEALMKIGEMEAKYREAFGERKAMEEAAKRLAEQLDDTNLAEMSKEDLQDLQKSLQDGDFQKAAESIRELAKQLNNNQLSDTEKQALAREMQKMLNNLPESPANEQLAEAMEAMQNGELSPEEQQQLAQQAQQQMEDMAQNMQDMQDMKNLQEGLADAKQEMVGDDFEGFDEKAVEDMMEQEARLGQGQGNMPGMPGQGDGQGNMPGQGNGPGTGGEGTGKGGLPGENKTDVAFENDKVDGKISQGKIINHMFVQGLPEKGEASEDYVNAVQSARQEATSSLARDKVPREYEEMVKNYFDTLETETP